MTLEELKRRDPAFVDAVLKAARREGAVEPDWKYDFTRYMEKAVRLFAENDLKGAEKALSIAVEVSDVMALAPEEAEKQHVGRTAGNFAYECRAYVRRQLRSDPEDEIVERMSEAIAAEIDNEILAELHATTTRQLRATWSPEAASALAHLANLNDRRQED